jgi:curved DNA-binding protein CbpA
MTRARLTVAEAARILHVADDATPEEVRAAFRRAIGASHPDRGGDDDRARLVVDARNALLVRARPEDSGSERPLPNRERTFVRRRRFAWR